MRFNSLTTVENLPLRYPPYLLDVISTMQLLGDRQYSN
jgi:hypothetical protein